jgi:GNAT superfamily N-acetyltransferase
VTDAPVTDEQDSPWPGELRPATDRDAAAVRRLIGGCFSEYEGCVLDPDGIDAWMAAPATSYADKGGEFWVLGKPERPILACVGWAPQGTNQVELKNLYVSSRARRQGLGTRLVALVETAARQQGAAEVVLWSDTRFLDAHRLYEGLGYRRTGRARALHDPSNSIEHGFLKRL